MVDVLYLTFKTIALLCAKKETEIWQEWIPTKQPSVRSESMVFNALKNNDHTRNWTVFYSVHVPIPRQQPREIDFLVIIPKYFCFICLEVKGGLFDIEKGKWYPLDSSGKRLKALSSSPHIQARGAMYALKDDCRRKSLKGFDTREYLSLECAVAFTDMSKPHPSLTFPEAHSIWSNDVQDSNKLWKKLEEIAKQAYNIRGPKNDKERKTYQYLVDIQEKLEGGPVNSNKQNIQFGFGHASGRIISPYK